MRALEERDATIRHLQNELDKYRQIIDLNVTSNLGPSGQRAKRQAISAEPPLRNDGKPLKKFSKSQRYEIYSSRRTTATATNGQR